MKVLQKKNITELQKMLEILRRKALGLRIKNSLSELNQTHLVRENRREIAKIQTALSMKRKGV